jgi:hypothetical protein
MNISDHLHQAARHPDADSLDLHRLARVARVQGTRARRRRRGVTLLGSAALVAVAAAGSAALLGSDPARPGSTAVRPAIASGTPTPGATTGTGRFTGRGVAAALRSTVADVAQGRAGAFAGQSGSEVYAQLDWTAADGLGVSVVGINVQPHMDFVSSCGETERRCTRTVTDGVTLTTYEEHTRVAGGVGVRRVADLLRADGTRVVVSATNGYDLPSNRWDVTRPQPPLSFAQLTSVVERPWWGSQLPMHFLEQGRRLSPYDDLDARWPAPEPTPR